MRIRSSIGILVFVSIILSSCQLPVSVGSTNQVSSQDSASLANRYADAVELAYETYSVDQSTGRAITTNRNALTNYFDELVIHDEQGRSTKFSSLSASQRKTFFAGWKQVTAEAMNRAITGSLEGTQELSDIMAAFDYAFSANRSASGDFSTFWNSYMTNYDARRSTLSASTSARSGGSTGSGVPDTVYWEGFYQLRNSYKQGNIIASDTAGVSPLGHASMFSEPAWDTKWDGPVLGAPGDWEINKTARISITSSPSTGTKEYFDAYGLQAPAEKSNLFYWGVSYEQLFCWVTNNTWIKHVKVFKPGYRDWSLFGDGTWHEASDADRARAVSNAISNFGKPYNTDWGNRDTTDAFYCSQIVWRAWYDIDTKYNFCPPLLPPGTGIAPSIMMTSSNLSSVADWNMDVPVTYFYFNQYFNGDGYLDKFRQTGTGWTSTGLIEISPSNSDGSYQPWRRLTNSELVTLLSLDKKMNYTIWDGSTGFGENGGQYKQHFADVNGDGRSDLIQVSTSSNAGWISYAKPDGTFTLWNATFGAGENGGQYKQFFADVNGDGRADLIQVSTSSSSGWISYAKPDGTFALWDATFGAGENSGHYKHYFADVNGDGRADLIQVSTDSNAGWISYAKPDGTFELWNANFGAGEDSGKYKHYFADVNGDGRSDLIQVSTSSNASWISYAKPDGTFHTWDKTLGIGENSGLYHQKFVDINGDHKADLVQVSTNSNAGWVSFAVDSY